MLVEEVAALEAREERLVAVEVVLEGGAGIMGEGEARSQGVRVGKAS